MTSDFFSFGNKMTLNYSILLRFNCSGGWPNFWNYRTKTAS